MGEDRSKSSTVSRGGSLPAALLLAALLSLLLPASALAVPDTTIDSGPSGTTADDTPTFTFSADEPGSTFECRVDDEPFAACSGPGDSHTTAPLPDGPHIFEVRAVDGSSNADPTPASRSFTVDTTPPDTTIDSGPGSLTRNDTPTFTFSSDEPGSTFECRVDGGPFGACSGPGRAHTTAPLPDGPHTFEVRAVDEAGNPDPSPDDRAFTVDTTPPNTTIGSGPGGLTGDATPTFTFSSGDSGASFECRVDGGPFAGCSGPGDSHTTAPLFDGPHTFEVRAVDAAANPDPTPASRSFNVDTTPPDTTIGFGPNGPTSDDTPSFGISSEPGSAFQCRIDDAPFVACEAPGGTYTSEPLPDGPHVFRVRAVDAAGNVDPTPATRSFTVDTTRPPDTTITRAPKGKVKTKQKRARVKVAFTGEEGATYRCKLDKGKYRRCASPYKVTVRSKSGKGRRHRISIRATDGAGNVGRPSVIRFRVLRTPKLRASAAQRTVIIALNRHGFAHRVVKAVRVNCERRNRYAFGCRFSSRFRGYRLRGSGPVRIGAGLSYRFRVIAQGVRFLLTDDNEASRLR